MILLTGYSGDIGSSIRSIAQLEKIKLGRLRFPRVELAAKNNLLSQLITVQNAARKNGVKVSVFHWDIRPQMLQLRSTALFTETL